MQIEIRMKGWKLYRQGRGKVTKEVELYIGLPQNIWTINTIILYPNT